MTVATVLISTTIIYSEVNENEIINATKSH
jgi:hypothetical protein